MEHRSSDLFSRALVLDGNGNPTTITKLSDEYLHLTYELRIYPPTTDTASTVELEGVVYDVIVRAADADSYGDSFGWDVERSAGSSGVNNIGYRAFNGGIGDYSGKPSGSYSSSDTPVCYAYTANSYTLYKKVFFDLDQGNLSGGIRSLYVQQGWGAWQFEFSAQGTGNAIPKSASKTLYFKVGHRWGRATL
ncbi:hypothetical protein ACJJH9_12215 [Microbulbifer sp. DLAB2-AF]|uniref:hypothetical protein n=1 Tax=Microbulbifer sp. DLAB2-AF TaxID=3243395 RepID=UPI00403A652E